MCEVNRKTTGWARIGLTLAAAGLAFAAPAAATAQAVLTQPEQTIIISRGMSALITPSGALERVSIADPEIAEAVPLSPREILINAKAVGSTSLVVWTVGDRPRLYAVEVYADVAGLQRQLTELFPNDGLTLSTQGSTVIVSGEARDPTVVRRAMEIAEASGATVINNITAPFPQQILLHVQFAEVNTTAVKRLGADLLALNPQRAGDAFDNLGDFAVTRSSAEGLRGDVEGDFLGIETLSEGLVNFMVFGEGTQLGATIRALKSTGDFKSLAEPNLMAIEGQPASFLAGGEFPYPVVQPGGNGNAVTVVFREYGIRLSFQPDITPNGTIRLKVNPEVSSLDFANGLTLAGFAVPSLLSRKVETEVELRPGQHLAIGGLLDNSMLENVDKIPILGDIPILGTFFKNTSQRRNHTELLVVVTPYFVEPQDAPIDPITGEPSAWSDWAPFGSMQTRPPQARPAPGDTIR